MASTNTNETATQCNTCRCGEGDTNIWTGRISDNPDKQQNNCPNCQVLKSGPLLLSSKGIGWTSWKKRWFILTRISLVFYRSDPNAPQKGVEPNVSLGGIDLNNSGSIVVKADKKLLTVLFPDGRDGRTITLKAETLDDLFEWKAALENALSQSPSPTVATGQNVITRSETLDAIEGKDRRPVKSLVIGRPILLALEDIDGTPSFLEKALRFIEDYGFKTEGILRQSADVEEVERRVREYEQGKTVFSPNEDAHIIGDCIKYVLRELPSSPVPATCCTALVEAYRTDRGSRIKAMRAAISETFPEPNRRLVQRILKMMLLVAAHKTENRMSLSALAACMAPLLLRPLLQGDCELEDDFNMGGDGSIQLLQAAAAANHAQAIVIILLEEYERIFDEDSSSDIYSESEDGYVENGSSDNDILEDDECNDRDNGLEADMEDDPEFSSSGTASECDSDVGSESYENQASEDQNSESSSPLENEDVQKDGILMTKKSKSSIKSSHESRELISGDHASKSPTVKSDDCDSPSSITKRADKSNEPRPSIKQSTTSRRASTRKRMPMESTDYSSDDEVYIRKLEMTKSDLQAKITEEHKANAILKESLERRKEEMNRHRLALQEDVERLHEELRKERNLRTSLEAGLMNSQPGQLPFTSSMDNKGVPDLYGQLSCQIYDSLCDTCQHLYARKEQQKDVNSTTPVQRFEILSNKEDNLSREALQSVEVRKQDPSSSSDRELPEKLQLTSTTQKDVKSPALSGVVTTSPYKVSAKEENATFLENDEGATQQALYPSSSSNRQHSSNQQKNKNQNSSGMRSSTDSYADGPTNENSKCTDRENVIVQSQVSQSSTDKQPQQKLQVNITDNSSTRYAGFNSQPSIEQPKPGQNYLSKRYSPRGENVKREHDFQSVAHDSASKMSTSRVENSMYEAGCENVKYQTKMLPKSPIKQGHHKLQSQTTNTNSKFTASSSISSFDEPSSGYSTAFKKSSTLRDQNSMQDQTPSTAQRNPMNQSNTKSQGSSISVTEDTTTFGRNTASKKHPMRSETMQSETHNPYSMSSRQLSQKQQQNSTSVSNMRYIGSSRASDEMPVLNRNAASRRSTLKSEEGATSTSSALSKLTNRLNFLKERRVQLVNQLQTLDTTRSSGPEGMPSKTSPR